MRYKLTLEIDNPEIAALLEPEIIRFGRERSTVEISKEKNTKFNITAKDAVALRATTDSIIQLLIVHEKMDKI